MIQIICVAGHGATLGKLPQVRKGPANDTLAQVSHRWRDGCDWDRCYIRRICPAGPEAIATRSLDDARHAAAGDDVNDAVAEPNDGWLHADDEESYAAADRSIVEAGSRTERLIEDNCGLTLRGTCRGIAR